MAASIAMLGKVVPTQLNLSSKKSTFNANAAVHMPKAMSSHAARSSGASGEWAYGRLLINLEMCFQRVFFSTTIERTHP
eukprot:35509-Pyramimonas_sp.AAC.1